MPTVTMPDGTDVEMPDTIDAQLGARLRAFHGAQTAKDYDPVPAGGPPKGFYAVTGDDGKQTLRHEDSLADVQRALSDLPGVGMAERIGQGAVRLGGKAASGIAGGVAGLFGGDAPGVIQKVRGAVNEATELPPSNDPLVQGMGAVQQGAQAVAAPVDRAIENLPDASRTIIQGGEEAIPDIAAVLGMRAAAPEVAATQEIARSPAEVAKAAGYTGLKTRADLKAPGNQSITDALIAKDAGIVPGQAPSVASLENARRVGPGRGYAKAEAAIPQKLTQDPELQVDLGNLPHQVSQLPRSPDVDALQETMLSQPEFTRDELFANIREARERAKAHWKSDDPDKGALGDAYHSLANAYEEFAGRQLDANPDAGVTLADWQADRVQMAKNYQAAGALRGEHFDPHVYGKIAERNPHLLTGNAAIVGHVANGLPPGAAASGELMPAAAGAAAGEAAGHFAGVPVVGGVMGAAAGPLIRAKLHDLIRRGNPEAAASASSNPALSYFFNQGRMPEGWNLAPSSPLPGAPLRLPAPDMVNAGGGASTASSLQNLGLTPDVQAAGAMHPAAARLADLRARLAQPPERPAEPMDFQGPQKWGDFSIAPQAPAAAPQGGIPFEDVLEQGGTQRRPVGAPAASRQAGPIARSPKQPNVRTPPGAPELAAEAAQKQASAAQMAFRNKLAAERLRKVAGDLSVEGPGGATGSPIDRVRAALERQRRGYAEGGSVEDSEAPPPQDALARNTPYAVPPPAGGYLTKLAPADEQKFQQWVQTAHIPFDPSSTADYDMRGFWQGLQSGDPHATTGVNPNDKQLHFSDWWKTPYHQSFSAESQWATAGAPKWNEKDQLVLPNGKVVFDERTPKTTDSQLRQRLRQLQLNASVGG